MPQRYWATISTSEASRPRARTFMRVTAMMPRRSLARRFARQVERDCCTIACDGGLALTSLRIGRATSQTLCRQIILRLRYWQRCARWTFAIYRCDGRIDDLGDE